MREGLFVTGTDTGVGKTIVALALIDGLKEAGLRVAGMKPIATGCVRTAEGLKNEDGLALLERSSVPLAYASVNPYAFEPPVAPHLAATTVDTEISLGAVNDVYRQLLQQVDCVVVEGIGGWRVPLNHQAFVSTLVRYLGLPALLVVGVRLGCINHALLTVEAIERDEVKMLGWVANQVDVDYRYVEATVTSLERFIEAPLLGMIPYLRPGEENTVPALLGEVVRAVLERQTVPL